ncbi:MAG: cupin domain-containing protein [Acidobacteria bacterium]|nr:cupin domain-containing protein [Acidobacteriota bacterium]
MSAPTHYRWDAVATKEVTPGIVRQFVSGARVSVAKFSLARGTSVPSHAHENEQVSYVVRGALNFRFGDRDVLVRAGEVIVIPSQVPHGVEVVEDSDAIDVFNPIRQDWIDGTDTYFQKR